MNDFYVYAWLRPCGTHFYIGKGRGNRDQKLKEHNPLFMRTVQKIRREGGEPYVFRIHDDLPENDAFLLEREEISKHGRRDTRTGILTNLTDGGEGASGYRHSDESKALISAVHIGKVLSEDTRLKIGMKSLGRKTFLGRTHSEDARSKMSAARCGTVADAATRQKMSESHTSRFADPVERERQSERLIKHWADPVNRAARIAAITPEVKSKIAEAARVRSLCPEWQASMRALNSTPEARAKNAEAQLSAPPKSSTGFKGITASGSKWRAKIVVNGAAISLGTHATQEAAARAYDAAAMKISSKAWLNFPAE